MPDLDQADATSGGPARGKSPSRRSVLHAAAGAGAAGVAAGTLAQLAAAGSAAAAPAGASSRAGNARIASQEESGSEAIVAHVRDAATGEIDVFHGTSVTRVRDKALATQLVRASR